MLVRLLTARSVISIYMWYNIGMSQASLPPFMKPFFWSYKLDDLDINDHKTLIIKQILNYGSQDAVRWLQQRYTEQDIRLVITNSAESEWGRKSLALWSLVYKTKPSRQTRFT